MKDMKKTYIQPATDMLEVNAQCIYATSPGVSDGDPVGDSMPEGDDDGNFFVKVYEGIW